MAHIVDEFQNGAAPEAIPLGYQTLSLEQVYGAITFYLANQEEVEQDMADRGRIEEEVIKAQPALPPELQQKLERPRARATAVTEKLIDDPLHPGCHRFFGVSSLLSHLERLTSRTAASVTFR